MTRRLRTTLLRVCAAVALAAAFGLSAGPARAAEATALRITATPHSKPLLKPASTPYRHTGSRAVALTFDDGPDPRWTPQVLALLRQYHIKATFCLIGVKVKAHPKLVRKIAADGHTLCNHTMRHDEKLKTKSQAAIDADLRATSALITKASGGVRPTYFGAPAGNWSGVIVSVARKQGMASIGWGVDPRDWSKPPTHTIIARVRAGLAPGVIVLMHDGGGDRSRTVAACKVLLPELTSKYRLTRL
jgi:peptidoglycan/xylan/chitin deacetylase (PgdA/CDA1 family)